MMNKTPPKAPFTIVTQEEKKEKGNVYYNSTFGDTFQTYAKVSIEGNEISRKNHIQVTIKQTILSHNHFEFLCPSETFSEKNIYPLSNSQKLMSTQFSVQLLRFKIRIHGMSNWVVSGTADMDVQGDLTMHTDKNMITNSHGNIESQSKGNIFNNSQKKIKKNSTNTSNLH